MTTSPLKVGLIGYGIAGRLLHAPLIEAAGAEITGVVTSRAGEVAADFPAARVFGSAEELCASDVDLVVIVSPDHLHVAQAQMALEANKHVVIDKPIAPTSAEALRLAEAAGKRRRMLSVFHNRRWDNDFLTLRKLIGDGALGDVVHYAVRWDRFRPTPAGTWRDTHMHGELYGLGSHLMDQAVQLFGAPDWLWADVYKQRDGDGQSDGFEILMGKGRLRMTLAVSLLAADEKRSCRVLGKQAAFTKTGLDPQEDRLRARQAVTATLGAESEAHFGVLTRGGSGETSRIPSEAGDWLAYYRAIVASIQNGAPPPVTAREAAQVIALLEAATESSRTGQRIDVPRWLHQHGVAG